MKMLSSMIRSLVFWSLLGTSAAQAGWISQGEMPSYVFPESSHCDVCASYYRATEGIHHFVGGRLEFSGPHCQAPTKTDYAFGLPQNDDQDQLAEILRGEYGTFRLIGRACGEEAAKSFQAANEGTREAWEGVFESTAYLMTARMALTPVLGRACKNGADHVEMKLRSNAGFLTDVVPLTRRDRIVRWLQ